MEYNYELKMPKERIAVLIGKAGETKKSIENATKTKINVDSVEGEVTIRGDDALGLYTAREIRSEERRVGKECRSRWSPYH